MMIEMMKTYVKRGESFSFETTLSGKNYTSYIPEWQCEFIQPDNIHPET
jgi:predicted ABC-type ATPase